MLSIIIPALNEENCLPVLLESVKKQNFQEDYEIIVADAGSKDKTVEIARRYGCQVVPGGLPAKGRNEGARVATGELFLFLDADVRLPQNFLKKSLKEFKKRKLDGASFRLTPQTKNIFKNIFLKLSFNFFYNWPITIFQKILAYGAMGILAKKEIFEKVGGFDENVKLAEDHFFARQVAKLGKFRIIHSTKIYINLRRFEKDGWLKTSSKFFLCNLYMLSGKPITSDVFKYRFNHYSKDGEI
jgi:glycosyltransferase involved in cell wall biosynthesis